MLGQLYVFDLYLVTGIQAFSIDFVLLIVVQ